MASDADDQFVRLEALMLGIRLFPDSEDLLKRRAVFLIDTNEKALSQFIEVYGSRVEDDFMWDLFKIRALAENGDIECQLKQLLERYKLHEDEEIIQFVALAHKHSKDQWLFDNLNWVKSRVDYPATLMYELARVAETGHQLVNARDLMELLTDEDPMNFDYWCVKADVNSSMGNFEEALNCLEYAKAIKSDDCDLASLEGYLYMQLEQPEKAVNRLELAIKSSNTSVAQPALQNLVEAYKQIGSTDKLRPLVARLFDEMPADEKRFLDMLILWPEVAEDTLKRFHEASLDAGEAETVQRITQLVATGAENAAIAYLNWYIDNVSDSQGLKFSLLELSYSAGKYQWCHDYLDEQFSGLVLEPNELPVILLIASILLRNRKWDEALKFSRHWYDQVKETRFNNSAYRLIAEGLKRSLSKIVDRLKINDQLTEAEIDDLAV